MFDITEIQSLHQLQELHHKLKGFFNKNNKVYCGVLAGNKIDLIDNNSGYIS